jgi:hypothetical protein
MNTKLLRKIRKRFTFNSCDRHIDDHGHRFFAYVVMDHRKERVIYCETFANVVSEMIYRGTGFFTWHDWFVRRASRREKLRYLKTKEQCT